MARLRALSIMYHDVVESGKYSASGFAGAGADLYKLDRQEFARHLEAIRAAIGDGEVCLTFDDGGVSAYETVAGMLERHGRRGHFFIATDWLGRRGVFYARHIRDLDRRGHVVGSHSCSHPTRMARLSGDQILEEWKRSTERLAAIGGCSGKVGSVAGGC